MRGFLVRLSALGLFVAGFVGGGALLSPSPATALPLGPVPQVIREYALAGLSLGGLQSGGSSSGGVASTRSISTGTSASTGLSGGGDLSADRSLSCVSASGSSVGCVDTTTQTFAGVKTFSSAMTSSVASGSNAINLLDGARINLSTGDASAYWYRSAANIIRTPGALTVDAAFVGSTGAFSGNISSTVASGSDAITLTSGARLKFGTCTLRESSSTVTINTCAQQVEQLNLGGTANVVSQVSNTINIKHAVVDGAAAVGARFFGAMVNATASPLCVNNTGTNSTAGDVACIDSQGAIQLNITGSAKPTCVAAHRGKIWYSKGAGGVLDALEVCRKDAGDAYAWVALF